MIPTLSDFDHFNDTLQMNLDEPPQYFLPSLILENYLERLMIQGMSWAG